MCKNNYSTNKSKRFSKEEKFKFSSAYRARFSPLDFNWITAKALGGRQKRSKNGRAYA